jgi:hypothetical protein
VDADSQGGWLTCLCTLDDPAMAGQATKVREGFACLVAFISKGLLYWLLFSSTAC